MPAFLNLTKELLEDLYINKHFSTWKIAKILGCARSTVYAKAILFRIPVRTRAESHIIYPRKDFSRDLVEKAYLIGFRIGDLRVRKFYKNSETIKLDCGSTKSEQIDLIKSLFSSYGRVWIGKPNRQGAIQIECFLNASFRFLLSKESPEWIFNIKKYFFSFLAGFTDAEGTIFISDNQAHYALGNYDLPLLQNIKSGLDKFAIKTPKITCHKRKGLIGSFGYKYNHDYWTLSVNRKVDLMKLFSYIGPRLKHKNRLKQMKIAVENIEERNRLYGQK